MSDDSIVYKVKMALITAGSTFSEEKREAYLSAIKKESNERAKWVLEQIIKNADIASSRRIPLCDDTGIPHLVLEMGDSSVITGKMMQDIQTGIEEGLKALPGRPMALKGNDTERIDQSAGISSASEDVLPAPIHIMKSQQDITRLHILMLGGGPAIRAKTYRIFHRHDVNVVVDEIVEWAKEGVKMLGCSPCTLAIGVGRSHYEAAAMMIEAMVEGKYGEQNDLEKRITDRLNSTNIGPLGIGGKTSVLASFIKVAPQRASGVRIVSIRPCCCFEPRISSVDL